VDEVIKFDQLKEIPERHLVFDRTMEIGDHPFSEGELEKFNMLLETGRGEDLGLETGVLLNGFEVSLDEVSLPITLKDLPVREIPLERLIMFSWSVLWKTSLTVQLLYLGTFTMIEESASLVSQFGQRKLGSPKDNIHHRVESSNYCGTHVQSLQKCLGAKHSIHHEDSVFVGDPLQLSNELVCEIFFISQR